MFRFSAPTVAPVAFLWPFVPLLEDLDLISGARLTTQKPRYLPAGPLAPGSPFIGGGQLQLGSTCLRNRELISSSNF